jgi:uncharacterized SAM-binding protein YcdF (DUF218 family)
LSEAATRASLARALGVSDAAFLMVGGVRTTREEVQALGPVFRTRNVRRVLLVTDAFHMQRARRLFSRAGVEAFPAPSDDVSVRASAPSDRWRLARQVMEEAVARGYYRAAGYL